MRRRQMFALAAGLVSIAATQGLAQSVGKAAPKVGQSVARIYLLRGFGDVFSQGLDVMSDALSANGLTNKVMNHSAWQAAADEILSARNSGERGPVILIGHSLGANAATDMAAELGRHGVAVDLLVSIAATAPDPVSANVRNAVSYYYSSEGWGEKLVPGRGFKGRLRNKDFAHVAGAGHFSIDKSGAVQKEILDMTFRAAGWRGGK